MSIDGEDLMSVAKLFHNFVAHTDNALWPKVVVLDLGTLRRYLLLERKFRWFLYGWINSLRYVGANPFKTLNVKSSLLNLIRLCMVSQRRSFNIGVICSFILESVTTLTAVFCIRWRRSIWYKGRPNNRIVIVIVETVFLLKLALRWCLSVGPLFPIVQWVSRAANHSVHQCVYSEHYPTPLCHYLSLLFVEDAYH